MNSGAPAEPLPPGAEPFAAPSSQAVWQSAPAEPLPPGAEPFAAPSSQAARLLPLRMDESILRTPDARKRDQLAVLSETPPQMQLVKRRICVKTTDAENIYGSKKFPQPEPLWKGPDQAVFEEMAPRKRYLTFMYWLRKWFRRLVQENKKRVNVWDLVEKAASKGFNKLTRYEKGELVGAYLEENHAPQWLVTWATVQFSMRDSAENAVFRAKTAFLTYNGDWGKVPVDKYVPLLSIDRTCSQLRSDPKLHQLWADIVTYTQWLCGLVGAQQWACSVELCSKTYEGGELRVHCHVFLKKDNGRMTVTDHHIWKFRESRPYVTGDETGFRFRGGSNAWAAAYYVQAPKIGVLYQAGSKRPFESYPVSQKWIFQLVQMEKITYKEARSELIKTGEGLCKILPDLDKHQAELTSGRLLKRASEVQELLATTASRSVCVPEVEAWKVKYGQGVWRRKKFLVLEGKSGTGKTEFVRSLFGPDKTLELNCAGIGAINLRDYRPLDHKVVLCDEASPSLVLANRKLFQCPPCWIDLGHSATGSLVYKVWINDSLFVIATNRWMSALDELVQEDREWLQANQVYIHVTEPLWVEEEDDW